MVKLECHGKRYRVGLSVCHKLKIQPMDFFFQDDISVRKVNFTYRIFLTKIFQNQIMSRLRIKETIKQIPNIQQVHIKLLFYGFENFFLGQFTPLKYQLFKFNFKQLKKAELP